MANERDLELTKDVLVALIQAGGAKGSFQDVVKQLATAIPTLCKAFREADGAADKPAGAAVPGSGIR